MLESEIVRLSGIGPAIWEAAANAVPLDQLAEEVGRVHGRHEGYRAAVAAAAGQLIAKSVLEQGGELAATARGPLDAGTRQRRPGWETHELE